MNRSVDVTGRSVLDMCTGSGVVAIAAAKRNPARVTAMDICPDAVEVAHRNAQSAGVDVDVRIGSHSTARMLAPFDVVVANPPYVPVGPDAHCETFPLSLGNPKAWNGGPDGRLVLDPLCDVAPELLADGGTMLVVQSEFADPAHSLRRLRRGGLHTAVVYRWRVPFGPVLDARAGWLERTGALQRGRRVEELVVIRADRP